MRKSLVGWMVGLFVLLAASAAAQELPKYLDIFTVKIKPDRHGEFMTGARKIADANRRYKGDNWVAVSSEYGESGLVSFASRRADMAQIEKGMDLFNKAGKEAFGPTMEKVMNDLIGSTEYARGELRLARWDISRNAPNDVAALDRLIGNARWLRSTTIRVKGNRRDDFEDWLRESKPAMEKADPGTTLVSQSAVGQDGLMYFVTVLAPSLAELEKRPPLRTVLGEEAYKKYMERMGDAITSVSSMIGRMRPELSNPPEAVVTVSQDFWTPKPAATAARKVKGEKKEKTQQ